MQPSYAEFEKALKALDEALREPKNSIVRDASIQRFEFCVELAWKTSKKMLGTTSSAPKLVIREMADNGLIDQPEAWFAFLEARNLGSHTYKEALAEKVYAVAKDFLPSGQNLLKKLKAL